MAKKRFLLGMLVIALVFGMMGFIGCEEEEPDNNQDDNNNEQISLPSAPTGVTATAASSSSIKVSWNAVSNAISYDIYRSSSASGSYTYVGTSASTSYTNTGLSASTTYYYKVAAYNDAGIGSQSSSVSATTSSSGGGITVPSAPTGVTATSASSSSITVSWNSVSNATSYYVYRSSSASGTYTQVGSPTSTSYTNTGLSASTTYYYKVAAYNSAGTSSQSSYASATTSSSGGGITVPSAPTGVTATRNSTTPTTVRVTWNTVSGATSYKVYYSNTNSGSGSLDGTSSTTSFDSVGNSTTATWYFRVTAVNSAGEGSPSSWVSVGPVSSGGGGNGSVTIVNNSSRDIRNFTLYQQGYNIIQGTGIYVFSATIQSGSSATWTNAPPGNYVRIGSETYQSYKVDKNTTFTVTAGQTTTVTITNSDVVSN